MVQTEGCSMLYGENNFTIRRCKQARNPFWSDQNKEIGYRDFRHFLAMIGPQNRGFIRKLHLVFEDATKSVASVLERTNLNPRYTNDSNLLAALQVVARDCSLRRLGMTFWGKRSLATHDMRFLDRICSIEADEVHINPDHCWSADKIEYRVLEILKKEMVRPEPVYDTTDRSQRSRFIQHPPRW
jgi:hypothetical protein